ncbi:MAG: hypothetical protein M1561_05560 [Gammaproteobacteria bacterium]|nr:hypothetical protein [Gammaproteobacteria bacterium]
MANTESKPGLLLSQIAMNSGILQRETREFQLKFLSQAQVLLKAQELCTNYLEEAKKSGAEPQMKFLIGIKAGLDKITTNSASLNDETIGSIYKWVRQTISREAMKRITNSFPSQSQSQSQSQAQAYPASAASFSAPVVSSTLSTIAEEDQTNANAATLTKTA